MTQEKAGSRYWKAVCRENQGLRLKDLRCDLPSQSSAAPQDIFAELLYNEGILFTINVESHADSTARQASRPGPRMARIIRVWKIYRLTSFFKSSKAILLLNTVFPHGGSRCKNRRCLTPP